MPHRPPNLAPLPHNHLVQRPQRRRILLPSHAHQILRLRPQDHRPPTTPLRRRKRHIHHNRHLPSRPLQPARPQRHHPARPRHARRRPHGVSPRRQQSRQVDRELSYKLHRRESPAAVLVGGGERRGTHEEGDDERYTADVVLLGEHHWAVDVSAERRPGVCAGEDLDRSYVWGCGGVGGGVEGVLSVGEWEEGGGGGGGGRGKWRVFGLDGWGE